MSSLNLKLKKKILVPVIIKFFVDSEISGSTVSEARPTSLDNLPEINSESPKSQSLSDTEEEKDWDETRKNVDILKSGFDEDISDKVIFFSKLGYIFPEFFRGEYFWIHLKNQSKFFRVWTINFHVPTVQDSSNISDLKIATLNCIQEIKSTNVYSANRLLLEAITSKSI